MASIHIARLAEPGEDVGPEHFAFSHDTGQAEPGEGHVLVRVEAVSVNPVDRMLATRRFAEGLGLTPPVTAGGDFVGTVVERGAGVDRLRPGRRVFGQASVLQGGSGSLASFVVARADRTARIDDDVADEQAAALPLAGSTALQALETLALQEGQKLLVLGAGGAVGSLAVQIALARGVRVVATAAGDDDAYPRSLGVKDVRDYADPAWAEGLAGFDGVLDASPASEREQRAALGSLRRGGTAVSLLAEPHASLADELGVRAVRQRTEPTVQRLKELAALAEAGTLRSRIAAAFELEDGADALTARGRGKVIVTL